MTKVAIFCAAGMSTSFLVSSIRKAAAKRGIELEIDAFPESQVKKFLGKVDVILLGPQIAYRKDAVEEMYRPYNTPVAGVPLKMYGTMDGDGVIDLVLQSLKKED